MADYYTQSFFPLNASDTEIDLLLEVDNYDIDTDRSAITPSDAFLAEFPPHDADPLSGSLAFMEDEQIEKYAYFSDMIRYWGEQRYLACDQIDLHSLTIFLQRICKSALPIPFSWSTTCTSMRDEDFGGGVTIIEADEISGWSSFDELAKARSKVTSN